MIHKIKEIHLKITKKNKLLKKISNKKNVLFIRNFAIAVSGIFVGTSVFNTIISINLLNSQKSGAQAPLTYNLVHSSGQSYTQIKKNVINRNVFNATGDIPSEDSDDNPLGLIKNFESVSCNTSDGKLPVDLVGILYTGNSNTNLVTFKDSRVETADVYREGQTFIEHDVYQVYKIASPYEVQIRHLNKKICLYTRTQVKASVKNSQNNTDMDNEQVYELDSEYVSDQIGPGFSKILNSARLVPESASGKTVGFKIYGISPGSIFEKMKFENGDIITSVNGINLEDPSQGFKIYEALQDETNITLQIKRAGVQMTKKVTVR
ncbi:PDZ domain-containing protein [Silvanigrella aquatica]|uniref:PDZ domain-containing protein n=1 Tax=Silvanigrella aquatica TaxID=1915309 RepID=A0A1L4CZA6_9BACT|nr:PDZ domain-containing protein [Silvanigrella aquatica]APJ03278.1 hypothetical protein AXG55_04925 [Silvanigrella aquatica]